MKKTCSIVLITLFMTTLFACKKDKGSATDPTELKGTWELESSITSMMPLTTFGTGNGTVLEIKGDTYAYYRNGQLVEQGNYTTSTDTVTRGECLIPYDKYQNRFATSNVTPAPTFSYFKILFYVEDNKLYMTAGCWALDSGSRTVFHRK